MPTPEGQALLDRWTIMSEMKRLERSGMSCEDAWDLIQASPTFADTLKRIVGNQMTCRQMHSSPVPNQGD